MRAVIGHSEEIETRDAIADVIAQCRKRLGRERPKAALLFMSVDYDHAGALAAIARSWPGLPLVGGSTDGELSSVGGFTADSILLTLLCGDDLEAQVGLGRDLSLDPAAAVAAATGSLGGREPRLCLTTFAPSTNSTAVVNALTDGLGGIPVFGGLSGDHRQYSRMAEFCGTEVLRDSVAVLTLSGNVKVGWGVGSGWFPMGQRHRVTRAAGHVVHEIDDLPARDIFLRSFGSLPSGSLGEYPMAVYPDGTEHFCLRAVLGSDPADGALRFAGDVPEGATIRVTEVLPEGILAGSTASVRNALASYPGDDPQVLLAFSCAARKWVLGTQASDEVEALVAYLHNHEQRIPVAGCYLFGEVAPLPDGGPSRFHNETCVTVTLGT